MNRRVYCGALTALAIVLASGFLGAPASAGMSQYSLGQTEVSANGLTYRFSVTYVTGTSKYLLELRIWNNTGSRMEVDYRTGEQYDFSVSNGSEILWRRNIYRFFVQSATTLVLEPQAEVVYGVEWDGVDNYWHVIESQRITLTATHTSSSHGISITLPDVQTYRSIAKHQASGEHGSWEIVPRDHWVYHALDYLTEQGVVPGYPLDYFNGAHELYRYDFVIAIQSALAYLECCPLDDPQLAIMLETLRAEFSQQL